MKNVTKTLILIFTLALGVMISPKVFGAGSNGQFDITLTQVQAGVRDSLNSANGIYEFDVNDAYDIELDWTESGGANVVVASDAAFTTPYSLNSTPITDTFFLIEILDLESLFGGSLTENESVYVKVDNGTDSDIVQLIFHVDAPTTPGIVSMTPTADSITNETDIHLTWSTSSESDYKIYVKHSGSTVYYDVTAHAGVDFDLDNAGVTIDISSTGLAVANGDVFIQVKQISNAGLESAASTAVKITYDSTSPAAPTGMILYDGATTIDVYRKDITKVAWTDSTSDDVIKFKLYYKIDDGSYVAIDEAIDPTAVYEDGIDLESGFDTGDLITFKLVAEDTAGNVSAELTKSFTFDETDPVFSIKYNTTSLMTSSSGDTTIISTNQDTILVENTLDDITSYAVTSTSGYNKSEAGDAAELQQVLRDLTSDGTYTVYVYDTAGNSAGPISFVLDQEKPIISNTTLSITSSDTKFYSPGVSSEIVITLTPSNTSSVTYKAYVNGVNVTSTYAESGSVGTVKFNIGTPKDGDIENLYEVRVYDAAGNYTAYSPRYHTTEDLVVPTARVLETRSTSDSIYFTVEVNDYNRTIDELYAYLYDNSTFVEKIEISEGTHEYVFDGLDDGESYYRIKVLADYDFNGVSYNDTQINNILTFGEEYNIDTLAASPDITADITTVDLDYDATNNNVDISIDITATKDTTSTDAYDVELYKITAGSTALVYTLQGTAVEVEMDTTAYTVADSVSFTDLDSYAYYQVRVVDGSDIIATYNLYTSKAIPNVIITPKTIEGESLDITFTIGDESNSLITTAGNEPYVNIVYEGDIIKTQTLVEGTQTISFTGLDFYEEYIVQVYGTYQLTDAGAITNDLLGSTSVFTAKKPPVATIYNIESTNDEVSFDVKIEDDDNALSETKVVLYKDGIQVGDSIYINEGTFRDRIFSGLDSNSDYRINVEVKYDLLDGDGTVVKDSYLTPTALNNAFYNIDFSTYKGIPEIDVIEYQLTNTSLEITVEVDDPDGAYEDGFIKLFSLTSSSPIKMYTLLGSTKQTFSFTGLDEDTTYRVVVDSNYDLEDGEGEQSEDIYDVKYKTHKAISADVLSVSKLANEITVTLDVVDYLVEDIYAKLYLGTMLIGDAKPLNVGENAITFTGLEYNTTYTLVVDYNDSATQLVNTEIQSSELEPLAVPTVEITTAEVTQDKVFIKAIVTDADDAATSIEVMFCVDGEACTVYTVSAAELTIGKEFELPADESVAMISVDYNTLITTGTVSASTDTLVRVVEDVEEPVDTTEPEDTTEDEVVPVEPENSPNTLVIVLSVLTVLSMGTLTVVGYLFFYKGYIKK